MKSHCKRCDVLHKIMIWFATSNKPVPSLGCRHRMAYLKTRTAFPSISFLSIPTRERKRFGREMCFLRARKQLILMFYMIAEVVKILFKNIFIGICRTLGMPKPTIFAQSSAES